MGTRTSCGGRLFAQSNPLGGREEAILPMEGFEAIRLTDYQGLDEEDKDTTVVGATDFSEKEVFCMPGFDGTGPMGVGPMTGGARGFCNPAYAGYGPAYGRGFGYGRWYGRGRGFRRGFGPGLGRGRGYGRGFGWRAFYPAWGASYGPAYGPLYGNPYWMSPEDELRMLRNEEDAIKSDLEGINKRIEELESKSSQS